MAPDDAAQDVFDQEDLQVAYVFDPEEDERPHERANKRRRVSKQAERENQGLEAPLLLVPLLSGAEKPECVQLRQQHLLDTWQGIDQQLKVILRDANSTTWNQVAAFVKSAGTERNDQIPSAFIITGPTIASQDLLFGQLSDTLRESEDLTPSRFVRLRSSDAATLKGALKKIIHDATAKESDEGDENDDMVVETEHTKRRYLNYDLEALYSYVKTHGYKHIFIAFQDSEGFDSGLLSELIQLLGSWTQRIPFTLLFGIATSVDLLQARLLKSACRVIYGAQFDVVQSGTILETILDKIIVSADAPLQLGRSLLQGVLDRQQNEVVGIQDFISSLQYAYMCHFYANPLSILGNVDTPNESILQPEHYQAIRNLPSFRSNIETLVESGTTDALQRAKSLIEDDGFLASQVQEITSQRTEWMGNLLRSLLVATSAGALNNSLCKEYINASSEGISFADMPHLVNSIRRLDASHLVTMLQRVVSLLADGDNSFALSPATNTGDAQLQIPLKEQLAKLEELIETTGDDGSSLRSKYNGQSRVMRTTVIAQKVQLSQDSASFRDEDRQFTGIVDEVTQLITSIAPVPPASSVLFSESWIYDSKSPMRDVLVPRPRTVFERSFTRPHDYLACSCCKANEGGMPATWPTTPILYRMYLETGNLINVADLWSAFGATVSDECEDERHALFMFYKGLAELRSLGFVKPTKKKADHIAKLKWL